MQVVSMEPKDPRGYNNLALALENDGDYAGARQVQILPSFIRVCTREWLYI